MSASAPDTDIGLIQIGLNSTKFNFNVFPTIFFLAPESPVADVVEKVWSQKVCSIFMKQAPVYKKKGNKLFHELHC